MIVSKFGGSSVASKFGALNINRIINGNKNIKIVVVSALGVCEKYKIKVTDQLINIYNLAKNNQPYESLLEDVLKRYQELSDDLKLNFNFLKYKNSIIKEFKKLNFDRDYILSRGEYLSAKLYSKYLKFNFLDAKDYIIFNKNGKINERETKSKLLKLDLRKNYVVGGFYGALNKKIKTFSRGGSDITGAIFARLLNAEEYENFTDVQGVFNCNPNLFSFSTQIPIMGYDDAIKIADLGSEIIHIDALKYLKDSNVLLRVKNSFCENGLETVILKNCQNSSNLIYICNSKKYLKIVKDYDFSLKDNTVVYYNNNYYLLFNNFNKEFKEVCMIVIFTKNKFSKNYLKKLKKITKNIKNKAILVNFLTIKNNFLIICENKYKEFVINNLNNNFVS